MSKLEELINEFCPEGVQYKKLGEVCEVKSGKRITKQQLVENGKYPVISGGMGIFGMYIFTI